MHQKEDAMMRIRLPPRCHARMAPAEAGIRAIPEVVAATVPDAAGQPPGICVLSGPAGRLAQTFAAAGTVPRRIGERASDAPVYSEARTAPPSLQRGLPHKANLSCVYCVLASLASVALLKVAIDAIDATDATDARNAMTQHGPSPILRFHPKSFPE